MTNWHEYLFFAWLLAASYTVGKASMILSDLRTPKHVEITVHKQEITNHKSQAEKPHHHHGPYAA